MSDRPTHTGAFLQLNLALYLTVKTLTGMTTDVYPRENCIAPAFGQRAAIDSKLAGFGRSFRADIHPMVGYSWVVGTVGKNLACEY